MITYHDDFTQGSEEWHAARCGLLTASEMHLIVHIPKPETRIKKDGTPYKQREWTPSETAAESAHLYELLGQRITGYVEPAYVSDAMLRGQTDEIEAVALYAETYEPVEHVGFITNDRWGFTIGYSPDALVGKRGQGRGQVECKSRAQKHQIRTLVDYVPAEEIDPDFMVQVQTGLLVTERDWCDLISYCGGLPMATVRVYPDERIQAAILAAATSFEERIEAALARYQTVMASKARLIPTERRIEQEMYA